VKKNLLVLMDDQHSRNHLGCYGNTLVKTPNLDALAGDGTRFTKGYTNSPICVPARASLATGKYVHEIGCWDNAIAYDGSIPSWGHFLQEAGIEVTSVGKLHYRFESDPTGFDEQIVAMHMADGVGDLMGSIRPDLPERTQSRKFSEKIGPGETEYTIYDRDISAKACEWLEGRAEESPGDSDDKPWVLFVSFIAPHFPLIVPQEYYDLYPLDQIPSIKQANPELVDHPWWQAFNNCYTFDRYFKDDEQRRVAIASYLGLCTFVDELIGNVLTSLSDNGFAETTNIAYFSDHGENLGARGLWGKSVMYEESVGIPVIMSGPDIPSAKIIETPVSLVDMFPTILQAMEVTSPTAMAERPGRSLLKIATEQDDPSRLIFSEYHGAAATSGAFMLRDGKYKYIHYVSYDPELYDLNNDPEEMTNLADDAEYQDVLEKFQTQLFELLDPEAVNTQALADQKALIESHGGVEKVLNRGGLAGTPVPGGASTLQKVT
jgi:choline-sulfatase